MREDLYNKVSDAVKISATRTYPAHRLSHVDAASDGKSLQRRKRRICGALRLQMWSVILPPWLRLWCLRGRSVKKPEASPDSSAIPMVVRTFSGVLSSSDVTSCLVITASVDQGAEGAPDLLPKRIARFAVTEDPANDRHL